MNKSRNNNFFYRMLCGTFLGISVIAPGISGSIMAVMMGIYDELITIISNPFKSLKKNIIYLLPMGIGAVISIVFLIKGLNFLFENYTIPAYLLFMSLIAGSIPTVLEEAKKEKIKAKYFIGTVLSLIFAIFIGFLAKSDFSVSINTSDVNSSAMKIYLPFCGLVSGMMSMLPGMSISMLLMMFSVYESLLKTATNILETNSWFTTGWYLDVFTMTTVVIAFVVGMIAFSNVTKIIFKKHHSLAFLMVLGFMLGSLISIFPGLPKGLLNWTLSIIAVIIGLSVANLFKILGRKFNK